MVVIFYLLAGFSALLGLGSLLQGHWVSLLLFLIATLGFVPPMRVTLARKMPKALVTLVASVALIAALVVVTNQVSDKTEAEFAPQRDQIIAKVEELFAAGDLDAAQKEIEKWSILQDPKLVEIEKKIKKQKSNSFAGGPVSSVKKLGDSFRLGDFTYVIGKVQKKQRVGGELSSYAAQSGAVLLVVNYEIANESKETKTILTDDFYLIDYKGRKFSVSMDAVTAHALSSDEDALFLTDVHPGLKRKALTIFEVPEDVITNPGLNLFVPQKGWGSSEVKVTIDRIE